MFWGLLFRDLGAFGFNWCFLGELGVLGAGLRCGPLGVGARLMPPQLWVKGSELGVSVFGLKGSGDFGFEAFRIWGFGNIVLMVSGFGLYSMFQRSGLKSARASVWRLEAEVFWSVSYAALLSWWLSAHRATL